MNVYKCLSKWQRSLEAFLYIEFSHSGTVPVLEISKDSDAYTRPTRTGSLIHLGAKCPVLTDAENEQDLFERTYYLLGHECQHIHSTVQHDWSTGMDKGLRVICQKLSMKVYGKPSTLITESDYERFLASLRSKGYSLSIRKLMMFVHFICNSLEDGRIEQIRLQTHKSFGRYMKIFRGKLWTENPVDEVSLDDMDAVKKLSLILDQILSLATTQCYQSGFLRLYGDSQIAEEIAGYLPAIKRSVSAPTCRECMQESIEIIRNLADLIVEASKMSEFEEFMENIMLIILDAMKDEYSSDEDEIGDGTTVVILGASVFDDDEKDDDGEEDSEESKKADGNSASGSSDSSSDDSSDKDKSEGEGSDSHTGNSAKPADDDSVQDSGSSSAREKSADEDAGKQAGDSAKSADSDSAQDSDDSSDESSDKPEDQNDADDSDETSDSSDSETDDASDEGSSPEDPDAKSLDEKIAEAIRDMLDDVHDFPEYDAAEDDAERQEKFKEEIGNLPKPKTERLSEKEIESLCKVYDYDLDIRIEKRDYTPDMMPPASIENSGASLRRKIQSALNKKIPLPARGMKSGKVDPKGLHRLGVGDYSIFQKKGTPEKIDVCAYLLQDNSGSMSGTRREACCKAFATVEEAFRGLMPLKLVVFDSYGNDNVHHVVLKDFEESAKPNYSWNFLRKGGSGYGNKDGSSIRIATREILKRPERDKILFIASDGLPTEYYGGFSEGMQDVRNAVVEAQKCGIHVIGMYMFDGQPEIETQKFLEMYAPYAMITDLDELETEIPRVVKNAFLKK